MTYSAAMTDPEMHRPSQAMHPHAFRMTLLDGREVELRPAIAGRLPGRRVSRDSESPQRALLVAPIAAPSAEQATALGISHPIRWRAIASGEQEGLIVGEGWFARHAGSPTSALLSLVVAPEFEASGLARILLETLVLGALEHGVEQVYALLPADGDECMPTLERLRARVTRAARGSLMARIDLSGSTRQLHASAPRARMRVAG